MNSKLPTTRLKLRPMFFAGLAWLVLGLSQQSMRVFAILGVMFMVISFRPRKAAQPASNAEPGGNQEPGA
ncbi:hypothetical protein D3Y59_07215 [Hymenobacter oligotrophus]|uniref:Uncharacterized protein n=1 Tax=Hymenobacter oligotrophus TaxID=2319843 RepID=A0A3B7R037_9BACT|nr:hypothetical protein [Hymenobacter oligotrophus]AYA36863.1 hypothetical protein D3Y59_07215 [Hymenobacter oligotrophus]